MKKLAAYIAAAASVLLYVQVCLREHAAPPRQASWSSAAIESPSLQSPPKGIQSHPATRSSNRDYFLLASRDQRNAAARNAANPNYLLRSGSRAFSEKYASAEGARAIDQYSNTGLVQSPLITVLSHKASEWGTQQDDLRVVGRDSAPGGILADGEKEASELTMRLSKQSLDSFYAVLFDHKGDSETGLGTPGAAPLGMVGGSAAIGSDSNPFAEAINNLKKNPAPGQSTPAAPAVADSQSSQSPAQQPGQKEAPSAKNPSQPATPPEQTPRPRNPAPQINIPGGTRPFTVVGDLTESGVGGVYPALRLQSNQFEIPRFGLANLRLLVVADPANSMSTVLVDDVDGDDVADVVMSSEMETNVMIYLGSPNGDFIYAGSSPTLYGARSIAAGNFNGDSKPDLAILRGVDSKSVDILCGTGDGRFAYAATTQLAGNSDMLVATIMGDSRRTDLFGTNLASFKSWMLFSGSDPLSFIKSVFTFTNLPTSQILQDINLDSRLEQFFLFQQSTKLSVVLTPPRGAVVRHIATVNLRYPMLLVLGDIFGQGFTDLGVARLKH